MCISYLVIVNPTNQFIRELYIKSVMCLYMIEYIQSHIKIFLDCNALEIRIILEELA